MNLPFLARSSVYGPEFYKEVLESKPFSFSLKYFFYLCAVFALALSLIFAFTAFPVMLGFMRQSIPTILNTYPQDLVISVENGEVSINQPEPYFIKTPDSWPVSENRPENLIVFNTQTEEFSTSQFDEYNTLVLVSKKDVAIKDERGKITIQSLKGSNNFTLNHDKVNSFLQPISGLINKAYPILALIALVFVFIGIWLGLTSRLTLLFIWALIIWLGAKIMKIDITYKKSYQIGIHALTISVAYFILEIFGLPHVDLLPTILVVGVALFNLYKAQPKPNPLPGV